MAQTTASAYVVPTDINVPDATNTLLQNACDDACSEADSYIQKRHKLPLVQWGADIRGACRKMARYYALSDRGFDPANAADQAVVMAYKDAIVWLRQVATGDVELVDCIDSSPTIDEAAPLFAGDAPHRWAWGTHHRGDD
jgi:phage gp36-like protein